MSCVLSPIYGKATSRFQDSIKLLSFFYLFIYLYKISVEFFLFSNVHTTFRDGSITQLNLTWTIGVRTLNVIRPLTKKLACTKGNWKCWRVYESSGRRKNEKGGCSSIEHIWGCYRSACATTSSRAVARVSHQRIFSLSPSSLFPVREQHHPPPPSVWIPPALRALTGRVAARPGMPCPKPPPVPPGSRSCSGRGVKFSVGCDAPCGRRIRWKK